MILQMNKPYFVISGLDLDVEFDYLTAEERAHSAIELDAFIENNNIKETCGTSIVDEDDIIYVPSTGSITYADTMIAYSEIADAMMDEELAG